jgi:hypothetical protein
VTSPMVSMKVPATPITAPSSNLKSKTHPPKSYDIVQGMERVINMMEKTPQVCERAQRSTQDASHCKTFPFGLRPSSNAHSHQVAKSIQIQFGWRESSGDLKVEPRAAAIHSTYRAPTTKAHSTPSVAASNGRRSTRSVMLHAVREPPRLQTLASSRRPGSASLPTTRAPPGGVS